MRQPLIVVPEIYRSSGGVQMFSLQFIAAVDAILRAKTPVISLNDQDQDLPPEFKEGRWVAPCGGRGRKVRFLLQTLRIPESSVLITTHPNPALWLGVRRKFTSQPLVCITHGIDVWNLPGQGLANALCRADQLLAVSRFTADSLRDQLGEGAPDISILPNTVDEQRFSPGEAQTPWRKRLELEDADKVMLTVGRVSQTEHRKGYDLILQALPKAMPQHPNLRWVLAGTGDDLERLREKAKTLGVDEFCRFPGFVPDMELSDLYRSADLFVLPSRKEGFGIVFLEAIACGLPVIGGNKDGSRDALADGQLGRLIDPESEAALLSAIDEVLSEPAPDAQRLYQECIARFGQDAFREKVRTLLEPYR